MPFDPELQAKVDAALARRNGGDPTDTSELAVLKGKLAKRDGRGGYAGNVEELKSRIAVLETADDNQD